MTDWIVRRWPLSATIGACLIFDVLSVHWLNLLSNWAVHWAAIGAVVGMWWGQVFLAVVIAGLAGRTWIEGFTIGLTLTLLGLAAFAFSMLASGEVRSFSTGELISLAAIPSLMSAVHTLSLADSQVTDDGLSHLAGERFAELNVSGTRITAERVRALKLANELFIAPGQFSAAERLSLEASGVEVQEKPKQP